MNPKQSIIRISVSCCVMIVIGFSTAKVTFANHEFSHPHSGAGISPAGLNCPFSAGSDQRVIDLDNASLHWLIPGIEYRDYALSTPIQAGTYSVELFAWDSYEWPSHPRYTNGLGSRADSTIQYNEAFRMEFYDTASGLNLTGASNRFTDVNDYAVDGVTRIDLNATAEVVNDTSDPLVVTADTAMIRAVAVQHSVFAGCMRITDLSAPTRECADNDSDGSCDPVDSRYCTDDNSDSFCDPIQPVQCLPGEAIGAGCTVCTDSNGGGICDNSCLDSNGDGQCESCGNNVTEIGEQCDDGNILSGDGCSNLCAVEPSTMCGTGPFTATPNATNACNLGTIVTPPGVSGTGFVASPWEWTCQYGVHVSPLCQAVLPPPTGGPACNTVDVTTAPTATTACAVGSTLAIGGITGVGTTASPWTWNCERGGQAIPCTSSALPPACGSDHTRDNLVVLPANLCPGHTDIDGLIETSTQWQWYCLNRITGESSGQCYAGKSVPPTSCVSSRCSQQGGCVQTNILITDTTGNECVSECQTDTDCGGGFLREVAP